jgi:glycosyltransferase involved in cell wall biosynthesis
MPRTLSVAIITKNEEANLARTLASVRWADEVVIVDSGSTDRTEEIALAFGAMFYREAWKGFGAQKNSAIAKCTCDWVLALDADEEVSAELAEDIGRRCLVADGGAAASGYELARRNLFLGRWIRHGGYYPDRKFRLFRRGTAQFEERAVHETIQQAGAVGRLQGDLIHHAYPTLESYLEHMNRYSSLGAEMAVAGGRARLGWAWFVWNVLMNPAATFIYNYAVRLGFLDGREGLLLHLYHSAYVSWKYAKVWQLRHRT